MSWWVGSVIIWENKTGSRPSLQHVKDDDGIFDEHTTLTGGTIGYGAALPNTSVTPHTCMNSKTGTMTFSKFKIAYGYTKSTKNEMCRVDGCIQKETF
eukprot:m.805764 g.805764  ORF g.805764 m.805764 type:complete len:98 (+) comp23375_c0_seq4:102-395(+)